MSVCAWCGRPATTNRVLEPEETVRRRRAGGFVTEIARPARTAHVCAEHDRIFEREDRVRQLLEQRARLEKRKRSPQANERHIDSLLDTIAGKLRELGYVEVHRRPKAAR